MAVETLISWTDATSNFWWGCTEVAPECDNCYAAKFARRTGKSKWGKDGTRRLIKSTEKDLRKLAQQAREVGHKKITFVSSMCDIFETDQTFKGQWMDHTGKPIATSFDEQRARAFDVIDSFPEIHFLLLTKRPQNILDNVPGNPVPPPIGFDWRWRSNVSYGTSAGVQRTWNTKVSQLMKCQHIAPSLFVSCEPMMEPVNVRGHKSMMPSVIFVGGESASKADVRPMDTDWALSVKKQVSNCDTIFHFKQLGSYATRGGEPMEYAHPKGEDKTEWPAGLVCQDLPKHWRSKLEEANSMIDVSQRVE